MKSLIGKIVTVILTALAAAALQGGAQAATAPRVRWQSACGGTNDEVLYGLGQAPDGGFLLAGTSFSGIGGNKTTAGFGGSDGWIMRMNTNGAALWDRTFGGTADDGVFAVHQAPGGGYILGGFSASSTNGNKTSQPFGARDFWVIRMDETGIKLWDRTYGGSRDDILYAIEATPDGGFLCAGESASAVSGNKTNAGYGGIDYWVVRIDANGNKLWDRAYGGTGDDICYGLQVLGDGGCVLAGTSDSGIGGNKSTSGYGAKDFWVLRLDPGGNKLWEVTLGGTGDDGANSVSILQTPDGGFLVGGDSTSDPGSGKSSPSYGLEDFWVVKLDANSGKLWERSFGGSGSDYLTSMTRSSDGNYVLAGGSESPPGEDKTSPNLGLVDLWLVCIDAGGNKLWEQSYGGTGEDGFYNATIVPTKSGGLMLGGDSNSGPSGNKTVSNHGGRDYWVVSLDLVTPPTLFAATQTDLSGKGFHFLLAGQTNQTYLTEYTTNFISWLPLSTNQLLSPSLEIIDRSASGAPARFYRAREWP
jgi:hypothetical protein